MRRLIAVLLALLMISSWAFASQDAPIASYGLPEGAEVFYLTQASEMPVPQGLEGMYALMGRAAQRGDVYLIRMGAGRALASVSCTPVYNDVTAQDMLALWPQIALGIEAEGADVDESATEAAVETLCGIEMLHVTTRIGVDGLWMEAEAMAFCRDQELTECWALCPENGLYAGDTAESSELSRDRRDLKLFMDSLSFPETWDEMPMGVPYTDRDGRFVMAIPDDAVVIDIHSTEDEVAAARARYIECNPEGAAHAFDDFMQDVKEERNVLIFTADMQGVIQIFASQEEDFRGATPEQLCMLAGAIERTLGERFDLAACLANDERVEISGLEHALLGYWIRSGELDLMLDIMASVIEDDWLYEVDIYASEGNQNMRTVLHSFVRQTMIYTPPQNGLSD